MYKRAREIGQVFTVGMTRVGRPRLGRPRTLGRLRQLKSPETDTRSTHLIGVWDTGQDLIWVWDTGHDLIWMGHATRSDLHYWTRLQSKIGSLSLCLSFFPALSLSRSLSLEDTATERESESERDRQTEGSVPDAGCNEPVSRSRHSHPIPWPSPPALRRTDTPPATSCVRNAMSKIVS